MQHLQASYSAINTHQSTNYETINKITTNAVLIFLLPFFLSTLKGLHIFFYLVFIFILGTVITGVLYLLSLALAPVVWDQAVDSCERHRGGRGGEVVTVNTKNAKKITS